MRKTLSIVLALLMLMLPIAGNAETAEATEQEAETAEQIVIDYDYEHLVVGNTTPMNGRFFTNMWGAVTSDLDVQRLIHGYNLVAWYSEKGGVYDIDPSVVSGIVVTENQAGDRTYTFDIYRDLCYSDGTKITARDYAFSWLLSIAPQIAEIGGNVKPMDYLLGYQDYVSGKTTYLSGIRLLDDYTIAITISKAYLPFFYEMALLDCVPYPIQAIAPGCKVADNGKGIYITPGLNAANLQETILNEATGYLSHPSVTSGPYVLTSYDGQTAELALNKYYKGNYKGIKPTIPQLTYKMVKNEDMLELLKTGEVGLLNKCVNVNVLQEGIPLVDEQDLFTMSSYGRSGLSYIAFCCEREPVNSQAVRQAIAMCMDKDGFVTDTVGDYGLRSDGYYGVGQWMYKLVNAEDGYPVDEPEEGASAAEKKAYEEAIAAWAALNMDDVRVYDLNVEAATGLLVSDGWTLNRNGEKYDAAKDDIRCKNVNGTITPLELKLICPTESKITEKLEKNFAAHLAEVGIQLTIEEQPMSELLNSFYRNNDRDCDMIYLANNFGIVFDPAGNFRPDSADAINRSNFTGINDAWLYSLAVDMRQTEPGDLLSYCEKWVEFQKRMQEVEPLIPLYSGMYYDFYPRVLQNYDINNNATWGEAIIEAYMGDYMEEETTEGGI